MLNDLEDPIGHTREVRFDFTYKHNRLIHCGVCRDLVEIYELVRTERERTLRGRGDALKTAP